jgi:metal-sulfur cluster biosynthetic enzyme
MITEEAVFKALSKVIDPELGIDIVSMGFIYSVGIEDGRVNVAMTLTTRGCPMHSTLTKQAEEAVLAETGASGVEVHLVFDPPWNIDMMSAEAKEKLGVG